MIPGATGHCVLHPSLPQGVGSVDDDDVDGVARGLSSSGNGSIVASMLRWLLALLSLSGGDGGGAGRLAEFLAGVRRTSIEAGRYKAGWRWMRLSTAGGRGWQQRRRLGRRSRGRGTSSGVAGDGDGRGLDDHSADAPPSRFRGGSLLPPLVNVPVDGDGSTVRGD